MTDIEWVNHASFMVRTGGKTLLSDPWLAGPAFNEGWELLVPSVHTPADVEAADALWISHVHPDHFVPRVLKAVSKEGRRNLPIYFQKTSDQQVAKFCRGIGYPVTEVGDGETVEIAPGFRMTVGRVPFYDSWSFLETPDARILNLNDCVVNRPRDLQRIKDRVGEVDVLLTQFSYANWIGGPADVAAREAAAAEKLEWMATQLSVIKPKACIPFASFVVFAHEENAHTNDRRNSVDDAVAVIRKAGVEPVVLYPGDVWTVGAVHDSTPATERYAAAWDTSQRELRQSAPVGWDELEHLAEAAVKRLAKRNNRALLRAASRVGVGGPLTVHLTDLDQGARFDPLRGLTRADVAAADADLRLGSQSFAYTLRFDWGADTLSVNGRFDATPEGYQKMLRTFGPALLNNNGRPLALRLLGDPWLVRRAVDRFVRKADG